MKIIGNLSKLKKIYQKSMKIEKNYHRNKRNNEIQQKQLKTYENQ